MEAATGVSFRGDLIRITPEMARKALQIDGEADRGDQAMLAEAEVVAQLIESGNQQAMRAKLDELTTQRSAVVQRLGTVYERMGQTTDRTSRLGLAAEADGIMVEL